MASGMLAAATVVQLAAQTPPQATPPQGNPVQGNPTATFPAQQRTLADEKVIERGKGIYTTICTACHGTDLRGGPTGGPNLLRSQVVLSDQHGELILPIVRGARAERGMPALPIPDEDVVAVAEYIHSVLAAGGRQGRPPETGAAPPNPIVGDAAAGEKYFAAKCSGCHSVTGDLQGIATRVPDGRALQNAWVSGSTGGGRGRGGRGGASAAALAGDSRAVTAVITTSTGERFEGPVVRMDNFLITILTADGSQRSFRRTATSPKVELMDPLAGHKAFLLELDDKNMHDVTAYLAGLK